MPSALLCAACQSPRSLKRHSSLVPTFLWFCIAHQPPVALLVYFLSSACLSFFQAPLFRLMHCTTRRPHGNTPASHRFNPLPARWLHLFPGLVQPLPVCPPLRAKPSCRSTHLSAVPTHTVRARVPAFSSATWQALCPGHFCPAPLPLTGPYCTTPAPIVPSPSPCCMSACWLQPRALVVCMQCTACLPVSNVKEACACSSRHATARPACMVVHH